MTVLTRVLYKKMYGRFARRPKKVAVMTDEVAVRRGFTVFKCTLMIFMVFMIDVTFFNFNKALTLKRNALYGITLYCV